MPEKFTVQYADPARKGEVPAYPIWVLGARDPHAHLALQHYYWSCKDNGASQAYLDTIQARMSECVRYSAEHGNTNPWE